MIKGLCLCLVGGRGADWSGGCVFEVVDAMVEVVAEGVDNAVVEVVAEGVDDAVVEVVAEGVDDAMVEVVAEVVEVEAVVASAFWKSSILLLNTIEAKKTVDNTISARLYCFFLIKKAITISVTGISKILLHDTIKSSKSKIKINNLFWFIILNRQN